MKGVKAEGFARGAALDPMRFLDPSLSGGAIERLLRVRVEVLDGHAPDSLLGDFDYDAARRHRLVPLLREEWMQAHLRTTVRKDQRDIGFVQLRLEHVLHEILELFFVEGIETRVLKGLATGRLDYPNPSMRHAGDVDLLVRPEQLARAVAALRSRKYRDDGTSRAVDPRLVKGVVMVGPSDVEIDLHTRLTRYAQQDIETLMADSQPLPCGALALSAELRLLHAAGHLMWSPPGGRRLSSMADMSVILDRGCDLDRAFRLAHELGIAGFVGPALRLEHAIRGRPIDVLASWDPPSSLQRRAFVRERRSVPMEHLLAFANMESSSGRLAYCGQFLFPGTGYIADRGGAAAYYGGMAGRLIPRRGAR